MIMPLLYDGLQYLWETGCLQAHASAYRTVMLKLKAGRKRKIKSIRSTRNTRNIRNIKNAKLKRVRYVKHTVKLLFKVCLGTSGVEQ
jgi:hypothetical protein